MLLTLNRLLTALFVLLPLLSGCGGPGPKETVRQFHIAALTQDKQALAKVMDTSGVTSPADDFRVLRDLLIFLTRQHQPTEEANATKLVDAACNFAPNDKYSGDGQEFHAVADLSRVLVPFLGDASRGVMGKPKDLIKYTVRVEQHGKRWVVTSIALPNQQLSLIGERYSLNINELDKIPGQVDDPAPSDGSSTSSAK